MPKASSSATTPSAVSTAIAPMDSAEQRSRTNVHPRRSQSSHSDGRKLYGKNWETLFSWHPDKKWVILKHNLINIFLTKEQLAHDHMFDVFQTLKKSITFLSSCRVVAVLPISSRKHWKITEHHPLTVSNLFIEFFKTSYKPIFYRNLLSSWIERISFPIRTFLENLKSSWTFSRKKFQII